MGGDIVMSDTVMCDEGRRLFLFMLYRVVQLSIIVLFFKIVDIGRGTELVS